MNAVMFLSLCAAVAVVGILWRKAMDGCDRLWAFWEARNALVVARADMQHTEMVLGDSDTGIHGAYPVVDLDAPAERESNYLPHHWE